MTNAQNFMARALELAKLAATKDEVPVGAIIVHQPTGKVLAETHNLVETNKQPHHHAELLAIETATKTLGEKWLTDCVLYVTLEPCPMCAGAISHARLSALYFGAYDVKSGGVDNGPRVLSSSSAHHKPDVYGGILEDECKALLQGYFAGKR